MAAVLAAPPPLPGANGWACTDCRTTASLSKARQAAQTPFPPPPTPQRARTRLRPA